jgi:hypothetical protein
MSDQLAIARVEFFEALPQDLGKPRTIHRVARIVSPVKDLLQEIRHVLRQFLPFSPHFSNQVPHAPPQPSTRLPLEGQAVGQTLERQHESLVDHVFDILLFSEQEMGIRRHRLIVVVDHALENLLPVHQADFVVRRCVHGSFPRLRVVPFYHRQGLRAHWA